MNLFTVYLSWLFPAEVVVHINDNKGFYPETLLTKEALIMSNQKTNKSVGIIAFKSIFKDIENKIFN